MVMKIGAYLHFGNIGDFMEEDKEPDMGNMINRQLDVTNSYKTTVNGAWKEGYKSLNSSNNLYESALKDGVGFDLVLQLQIDAAKKSQNPKKSEKREALPDIRDESHYIDFVEKKCYHPFRGIISAKDYLIMVEIGKSIGLASERILEIEHDFTYKAKTTWDSFSCK